MDRISVTRRTAAGRRRHARWPLATGAVALSAAAIAVVPGTAALAAPARTAHLQSSPVAALPRASAAQQLATLAFWTPRRMAEAKSFDIISDSRVGSPTAPTADPYAGKPEMVPGGLPVDDSAAVLDRPSAAAASNTFGAVPPTLATTYPYRMNGKIFFTWDGELGQCSGTSVVSYQGASDEDEVWTAGHCLVNAEGADGIYSTNIEFVPAYNGNASTFAAMNPFGVFPYVAGETTTAWLDNADVSEDEAALVVGTNSAGQTLGQAVGEEGFAWNQNDSQYFTTFGYPAESPFTGTTMYEDIAATDMTYRLPGGAGQPMIGVVSPMNKGSSGGAWNIDWSTANAGYIDGHNDYANPADPGVVFSPYQDTLSNVVRCFGRTSC